MALHRDIYWVGKQWAVTGHGIQACDQKQKAKFDIEASRVWEEGLLDSLRAQAWLNVDDFSKALAVARKHFPDSRKANAPEQRAIGLTKAATEAASKSTSAEENPVEAPKTQAANFELRIDRCRAKFLSQWRVRIRR